jgi:hypothetical protein
MMPASPIILVTKHSSVSLQRRPVADFVASQQQQSYTLLEHSLLRFFFEGG